MPKINAEDKVLITYKGRTEVYDGVVVAAVTSMEGEESNEKTRNDDDRVELVKLDLFLLGSMCNDEILAMEQKFLRDSWHMWGDSGKAAIIDTLRSLVAIDEAKEAEGEGENYRVHPF